MQLSVHLAILSSLNVHQYSFKSKTYVLCLKTIFQFSICRIYKRTLTCFDFVES